MANVDGIQGAQAMQQAGAGAGMRAHMQKIMGSVADKLGMSQDDLQAALNGGTSLADIAQSKGVSRDDLVATVSDAIARNRPAGAPQIDAQQLAGRMVDHVRGHHGHHHHGGGAAGGVQDPAGNGSGGTATTVDALA